ncbi:MAG: hypothetical protein CMJ58_12085 [Planctomycetaceae bacterium]|nr:hypothetical protein [Planctomycetaceae bacterium]
MPHVLRHVSPAKRRTSIRCALANAGLWGAGNGLVSVTLVRYLANEIGASGIAIAWILAAPELAGALRVFAPWWVHRLGSRKKFCVRLYTVSAILLLALPVIAAPHVLPLRGESLLALGALWFFFHLLEYVAAVALWSWLGELTPPSVRGSFFGRRESWLNVGRAVGMFAAAFFSLYWNRRCSELDRPHDLWIGYAACAVVGAVCFLLAVIPLRRVADRQQPLDEQRPPPLRSLLLPFLDSRYRRLLLFGVWFSAANGLFYAVRSLYEMRQIQLPFFHKKMLDAGSRGVQSRLSPLAGRQVDRRGNVPVLALTQAAISLAPLFYVLASPDAVWWIIGAYVCWLAYAGMNVAQPNLMIGLSPRDRRATFIAVWFAVNQLALTVGFFLGAKLLQLVVSYEALHPAALLATTIYPTSIAPAGALPITAMAVTGGCANSPTDNLTGLLIATALVQLAGAWWALRIPEPETEDNGAPPAGDGAEEKSG